MQLPRGGLEGRAIVVLMPVTGSMTKSLYRPAFRRMALIVSRISHSRFAIAR